MNSGGKGLELDAPAPPKEDQYGSHIGRIARGVGVSSSGVVIGRVMGYVTQVALAQMFGPAQLGFYVLGRGSLQLLNILSQIGMDNGVVRYVAHYRAEKDDARVRGTIIFAIGVACAMSLILSTLLFFGAGFLAEHIFHKPFLETVFKGFSLCLPFLTLMTMTLWATQGFQTMKYNTYVLQIYQPLMNLVLVVAFFYLGTQIMGAVAAYVLSMVGGSVIALLYLRKVFPQILDRTIPPKYDGRALVGASAPLVVANFTQYINAWSSVTILGIFASAAQVGIFSAASRTAMISALVLHAFSGTFSPMISSLYRKGQLEDLNKLYRDVARWSFTGTLALSVLAMVLSKDIMVVFGKEFVVGWSAIVVVGVAQIFYSSVGPAQRVLAMTGRQKIVMLGTLSSVTSVVVLNFLLIPRYGIMGAAFATAGGIVLINVITVLGVRTGLRFSPYSYKYYKPVLAGVVAAAIVLLAKPLVPGGILSLIILSPFFALVYVLALLALKLEPSDRQLLESLWRAVRNTVRR